MTTVRRSRVAGVLLALAAAGCTTTVYQSPAPAAAVAPQLTVERFLQAANARDVDALSRLFGTVDGPMGDTGSTFGCFFKKIGSWFGGTACRSRSDVEIQLDAIARVLQHQDYRIDREESVAGRPNPTRRVFVDLRQGNRTIQDLAFEVVRTGDGRWLVERVPLDRVMGEGR